MMKKFLYVISLFIALVVTNTGCGGGGGGDTSSTSSSPTQEKTVVINGSVNDKPIPYAKVQLILKPQEKMIQELVADKYGKWSCKIQKALLPQNSYILIRATNDQNVTIRSLVDTDDILESGKNFESNETTVSHYTEAVIALAEANEENHEEQSKAIKKLIKVKNGIPQATESEDVNKLANTIQTYFDSNTTSQDIFALAIYKELLATKLSSILPNDEGVVKIDVPAAYNKEIVLDMTTSIPVNIMKNDNVFTLHLTPQQMQKDITLNITAKLHDEVMQKTLTLYALGNTSSHYKFTAVAPLSNQQQNIKSIMINGRYYTVVPYSFVSIDPTNAQLEGIKLNVKLQNRDFGSIEVAKNYENSKILMKIYASQDKFDVTTLVATTALILLDQDKVDIGNITLAHMDDYKVPQPNDTIELPPMAPEF